MAMLGMRANHSVPPNARGGIGCSGKGSMPLVVCLLHCPPELPAM